MKQPKRHKRARKRSTASSAKTGGSRHAERARKAKPFIRRDGIYSKSRHELPRNHPSALYDPCPFCHGMAMYSDEEEHPIVWRCLLACEAAHPRCVQCFPKERQPKASSLLAWDALHWGKLDNARHRECGSFEVLLASTMRAHTPGHYGGVPSPSRDLVQYSALCACAAWNQANEHESRYRRLVSVVRRLAHAQRVPLLELRAALAAADLQERQPGILQLSKPNYDPLNGLPKPMWPSVALTCTAMSAIVRHGPYESAVSRLARAAVRVADVGGSIEAEMQVRAQLGRWCAHGGRVSDEVVDAAAAAWMVGHRAFAKALGQRETIGRNRVRGVLAPQTTR